ncbi:hypothetical protein ACJX0J_019782 [Zea mays]
MGQTFSTRASGSTLLRTKEVHWSEACHAHAISLHHGNVTADENLSKNTILIYNKNEIREINCSVIKA